MLVEKVNEVTELDKRWNLFFQLYKTDILEKVKLLYKEEDIWGKSKLQLSILQYTIAFNLIALISLDYQLNYRKGWDYFIIKYHLHKVKLKFKCNSIILNDILSIFNLPKLHLAEQGVDSLEIEQNLVVEDLYTPLRENYEGETFDLINMIGETFNLLETICPIMYCVETETTLTSTYNILYSDGVSTGNLMVDEETNLTWK